MKTRRRGLHHAARSSYYAFTLTFGEVSNKRHTLISRTSSASSFRTYTELPARDHQHPGRFKGFLPLNSENYTKIQRSRHNFAANRLSPRKEKKPAFAEHGSGWRKETFGFSNPNIYPPQHATDLSSFRRRTGIADN